MTAMGTLTRPAAWLLLAALALAACAGPPPSGRLQDTADAEWARTMRIGRTAYTGGQIELAGKFYRSALARGRAMDSASAIADAAYNLAACRMHQGRYAEARALLKEARAEAKRSNGATGDILLLAAKAAILLGEPEEALALAEELLGLPKSATTTAPQLQGYLLRGHIACERGDTPRALSELQQAEQGYFEGAGPAIDAGFCELAGCICLQQKKPAEAARRFDQETDFLKDARLFRKMTASLARAADAYGQAGDHRESADRFFRAARSAYTQGDKEAAIALGQKALRAAEKADEPDLLERSRALLDEIRAKIFPQQAQEASFSQEASASSQEAGSSPDVPVPHPPMPSPRSR